MNNVPVNYVSNHFWHKNYYLFSCKEFYVGNTTDWKIWGGARYLEIIFVMVVFSTAYYVNIYHCNVGKTKRLEKNVKENIWCHKQTKMNRKKYVYLDNDPYMQWKYWRRAPPAESAPGVYLY